MEVQWFLVLGKNYASRCIHSLCFVFEMFNLELTAMKTSRDVPGI